MRAILLFSFLIVPARGPTTAPDATVRRWNFDADAPGRLPAGWNAATGRWQVASVDGAPSGGRVLVQEAENETKVYNVVLADQPVLRDVELSVRLRAVKGKIDQGGGLVWRAKDAENYYIARWNPLESNFRVYKVENGRRTQLGSAEVKVPETWHKMQVKMTGNRIQCFFDGDRHLDVTDDTFKDAGRVGLWTKADAQTHFDDLTVIGR